ncbi:MAG: hypothetical protein K2Y51_25975 [Gammaproteobacteria bacterium]|nr:hypothetical protein [Gammaproteobacteria bacterium]
MVPFQTYATVALIVIAAYVTWDWQHQRQARAAEAAQHAQAMQTARDNLEAKDATIGQLKAQREDADRALASAEAAARAAVREHDRGEQARAALARERPDVRAFLDTRMPGELYDCLRDAGPCADEDGDGVAAPAGAPGDAAAGAGAGGRHDRGHRAGVAGDPARAEDVQRPRGGARRVDGGASRGEGA